jgi:Family of unknown function (DUF6492)
VRPLVASDLVVITPSCAADLELCRDLHRSVLEFTPEETVHYVIVPRQDIGLFGTLSGPRTIILDERELLPRNMVYLPRLRFRINVRHPWPPIRGWITQQLIKLALVAHLDAAAVLSVDSDVELIRPVSSAAFTGAAGLRLYRLPDAIDRGMVRHVSWHRTAERLLGTPPDSPDPLPLPDYVTSFGAFDPSLVRRMRDRIQSCTGRNWLDSIAAELHFSEWITYGVYVDSLSDIPRERTAHCQCLNYWDPMPLDSESIDRFLDSIGLADVAVMISAKSRTPLDIRRAAIARMRARL